MYLGSPAPSPAKHKVVLKPYNGVEDSVAAMQKFATDGQVHPQIRRYAEEVVRKVYPKDYLSELAAIYYDTCRTQRYTRDPEGREYVQHPALVLQYRASDCDDQATLIRSLAGAAGLSVGNPMRFIIVGFNPKANPGSMFTHVFLQAFDPKSGQWVTVDPVAGPTTRTMLNRIKVFRAYST